MSKTTFRAILTVLFIMAAGVLLMFSDDNRREKVERLVDQGMDYVQGAKDSAMTAIDGAKKGFGDAKDALNKTQ
jgi:type II secretory pathway component PulK